MPSDYLSPNATLEGTAGKHGLPVPWRLRCRVTPQLQRFAASAVRKFGQA